MIGLKSMMIADGVHGSPESMIQRMIVLRQEEIKTLQAQLSGLMLTLLTSPPSPTPTLSSSSSLSPSSSTPGTFQMEPMDVDFNQVANTSCVISSRGLKF